MAALELARGARRGPGNFAQRPASPASGPIGASTGRPRLVGASLRLVHRGLRHAGFDRGGNAARYAVGIVGFVETLALHMWSPCPMRIQAFAGDAPPPR